MDVYDMLVCTKTLIHATNILIDREDSKSPVMFKVRYTE